MSDDLPPNWEEYVQEAIPEFVAAVQEKIAYLREERLKELRGLKNEEKTFGMHKCLLQAEENLVLAAADMIAVSRLMSDAAREHEPGEANQILEHHTDMIDRIRIVVQDLQVMRISLGDPDTRE